MTTILSAVLTRVEVADLDAALPAYRALLASTEEIRRLDFPEFRMAIVGPFMLLEGTKEQLAPFRRTATLLVADHDAAVEAFVDAGGHVVDGPVGSAGGLRTIVEDKDGTVFEIYLANRS
jgi:predicted enzyme related to lactoylglutathione lyase